VALAIEGQSLNVAGEEVGSETITDEGLRGSGGGWRLGETRGRRWNATRAAGGGRVGGGSQRGRGKIKPPGAMQLQAWEEE
jgi:hypothetical protein